MNRISKVAREYRQKCLHLILNYSCLLMPHITLIFPITFLYFSSTVLHEISCIIQMFYFHVTPYHFPTFIVLFFSFSSFNDMDNPVPMKNAVFWGSAPCRSCVNRRFGGRYCLRLQGRKIRKRGASVSRWLQSTAGSSLADFLPWKWRRYLPPKRLFTQDLHGAKSQRAAFFIVTPVKTSNLTNRFLLCLLIPSSTRSSSASVFYFHLK
jgi:hypothetical protein